jgi:hypothetical protein
MSASEDGQDKKPSEPEFDAEAFEAAVGTSPLDEDAAQMHEVFLSLMKAGFLEHQALRLVAYLIAEAQEEGQIVFMPADDDDEDDEEDED